MKIALKQENADEFQTSDRNDNVVYYVTGCVILKFLKCDKCCALCASSLQIAEDDLPENFTAAEFTTLKSKRKLKFASSNLFALINKLSSL